MRRPCCCAAGGVSLIGLVLLTLCAPNPAAARPVPAPQGFPSALQAPDPDQPQSFLVTGTGGGSPYDTTWFGGTVWNADSSRWEAVPGGRWTFESGVGSSVTPLPPGGKPAGYHSIMEGWRGIDLTLPPDFNFRRTSTCAISGSNSMWLGATQSEADSLAWAGGRGYGNSFDGSLVQAFSYPGTGNVTLQYQYAVESEPGYDYLEVLVQRSDQAGEITLKHYEGTTAGTETIVLTQGGGTLPAGAGTVTIRFHGESDGSYSDEDGLYPTSCGLAAVDNIALSGAISHSATFESGTDGWTAQPHGPGVGDFSNLRRVSDLPPVASQFFCNTCGMKDSVLVFTDPLGGHPSDQFSIIVSPWIDLKAAGEVNRPGKIVELSLYSLQQNVSPAVRRGWQYYPWRNPQTGKIMVSPIQYNDTYFYFGSPFCGRMRIDLTGYLNGAEQIRAVLGPILDPNSAASPYFDNIRFGTFGPTNAPSIGTNYWLQDAFATDGTLNPASTGRIDTDFPRGTNTIPVAGDTLVIGGDGGNTEVRLVFHVRPGPFTNAAALASVATRWTAEPSIGSGWYSARMDTAEFHGSHSSFFIQWMSTFHESDPGFQGTDTTPDPSDPGELANEILPDHVLTPGSRIDYFVKARYLPPDPRNPGGTAWFITPDTTGGNYREMEILPSSMAADTTWNCVLEVDAHHGDGSSSNEIEEDALKVAMGGGTGNNAEGTPFDRLDVGGNAQIAIGRAAGSVVGATVAQLNAYHEILWYQGLRSHRLESSDAAALDAWIKSPGPRAFWANGNDFVAGNNSGAAKTFVNGTLGARLTCTGAYANACPSGTTLDSTNCLPLTGASSPAFAASGPASVRGNGCPTVVSYDVMAPDPAVPTAAGNVAYLKNGLPGNFASITNDTPSGYSYRSVTDGFPVSMLRRPALNPHDPGQCANVTPVYERTLDVLRWLSGSGCPVSGVTGAPEPGSPEPVGRPWLGEAWPNPMSSRTTIPLHIAGAASTRAVEIFDVSGRLVRTLSLAGLMPGHHDIAWDGKTATGQPVAAGLYFYRMTAPGFTEARKILVVR